VRVAERCRSVTGTTADDGSSTAAYSAAPSPTAGVPASGSAASSSSSTSNTGAIAGGVVGGVAVLAIVGLVLYFFLRRRNRRQPRETMSLVDDNKADSLAEAGVVDPFVVEHGAAQRTESERGATTATSETQQPTAASSTSGEVTQSSKSARDTTRHAVNRSDNLALEPGHAGSSQQPEAARADMPPVREQDAGFLASSELDERPTLPPDYDAATADRRAGGRSSLAKRVDV